ncbi:DUF397 domain-containing protein [Streptomyces sp. BRA346]|uniref:DUF397 domain-containing protein n=1 Tax=Streptomyces sp. BRA346 TaxID=2878199 RepID=UPI0040637453
MQVNRPGWSKSSYSAQNGDCVEVQRRAADRVGLRDSKTPSGPVLEFAGVEWVNFIRGIRNKKFEFGE